MARRGFTDLDEELEQLGYGNQWDKTLERMEPIDAERKRSDLERLNEWNRQNPEKHAQAIRNWYKRRREEIDPLIGTMFCPCGKALTTHDLMFRKEKCRQCR